MILKALVYAALLFVMWIFVLWLNQRSMQYFPDTSAPADPHDLYRDAAAKTKNGLTLRGWHAPARPGMPTIVLFHGNGGNFRGRAPDFLPFVQAGYGVLLTEYRGYGGNPGKPTENGLYHDAEAWLEYLSLPMKEIVLYGESLGSGIAVEMAKRYPDIGAVVLENAYTSMRDLATAHYRSVPFARYLVRDPYETDSKIADLRMPKMFLIAEKDSIVPPAMGRRLYDLAPEPKTLKTYPDAEHNDIRDHGAVQDVIRFLRERLPTPPRS